MVVLGQPSGMDLDLPSECVVSSNVADAGEVVAVIAFVTRAQELDVQNGQAVLEAACEDRLAWVVYPKARQLGTDLSRDILAALAQKRGAQPVRSVSVEGVWSGLRLRPL